MIERIIRWSAANRLLVLLAAAFITAAGLYTVSRTPLDAIPDLSDVQVIIRTPYPGQAPQIVEAQVTYPIATTMLSAPKVKAVRAFSMFGDSFVTIIFEDGTDLYWARSRVLEYLNQAAGRLPPGVTPALGPDATGVGWAYQYALVDRTGGNDLGQLRALQDWFLRYQLKEVPGVAEVASVGGMVRAFQVEVNPEKLQLYRVSVSDVMEALQTANNETGGSVIERAEAEYMIRVGGYLQSLDDFRNIPLKVSAGGVPVTIGDVARVQIVPEFRRGIAELNGQGEDRQERERDDQEGKEQRRPDLNGRVHQRSLAQLLGHAPMLVLSVLELLVSILDHHHGRIDHGADRQRDTSKRKDVRVNPLIVHHDERGDDS